MIELNNVQKHYGKKQVLEIEKLVFKNGDIIGLIGKNGAGKTTLAEIILGTNEQSSGQITYHPPFKTLRRNAVFQESSFDILVNLRQIARFYKEIFKLKTLDLDQIFQEFGLADYQKKRFSKLSGGEKQRFKLLVGLMNQPNLVLFDEVANSLDYETKKWVIKYIKNYDVNDKIVIIISHDPHEIKMLCNRIVKLVDGKVTADFYLKNETQTLKRIEDLMSYEKSL